ncbi:MAG: FAD-dependent oxidoreductase [Armatimonadetes bacterium]|nr:FAD-dependent oxidoreductase [Armatimonadota bacterium]
MSGNFSPADTQSIWIKTSLEPKYPVLPPGEHFDVAIVGAGIVGIMTAYELRQTGLRVALIEGEKILQGVTGYTTGKLTSQHGLIYDRIRKDLGVEGARKYFDANEWAITDIRTMAELENIPCDITRADAHVVIHEESSDTDLESETDALTEAAIPHEVVRSPDPRHGGRAVLKFPNQAHFHPRNFLLAILSQCAQANVHVFENSRITEIDDSSGVCRLRYFGGEVTATQVVLSTHYPILDSGFFVAKLAPYRSYAIAVKLSEPVPPGMFIGHEEEGMRSTRPAFAYGEPVLIVGGENHKVGQSTDSAACFQALEDWARTHYQVESIYAHWSTQDNWTPDHRPFIGKSPGKENIFVATGFGGWGMTTGRVAAHILAKQIVCENHAWEELYNPSRFVLDMLPDLLKENLNVAAQYIGDKVKAVETRSAEDLVPGEAQVLQTSEGRVAAYRDAQGALHTVSADCTHMGCQVAWNNAEKTWDCPCHGSRFSPDGEVIHSPATKPLKATGA